MSTQNNPLITGDLPFLDLFIPPKGYKLDFLEMTTFSLSLSLLATLPFLLYQGEHGGIMNEEVIGNPQRFMKRRVDSNDPTSSYIYENYSKKFRLLYDGKTKYHVDSIQASPSVLRVANYLLEHSCKDVVIKNGLFHPKIMLFQFKHTDTSKPEFFYRLMVGSRNFTMSNYLETGICLEGAGVDDKDLTLTDINRPLFEFFGKYCDCSSLDAKNYPPCIHWVNFLNTPLKATQKGVTATGIYFGGNTGTIEISDSDKSGDSIAKSVNSIAQGICSEISTAEKFEQNKPMLIVSMKPTYGLFIANDHNHFVQNPTNPIAPNPKNQWYLTSEEKHKLLHSKLFMYQQDKKLVLWIGSANCTAKGLNGNNEEVMVRCESEGTLKFPSSGDHFTEDTIYTQNVLSVEEMDNEETVCPVKVESEWDSPNSQWKLTLSATSTKKSASVWNVFPLVGGNMVQVTVPAYSMPPSSVEVTFPMKQKNFTNIFIIQSPDQKQTYRHVADMSKVCGGVKPRLTTLLGDIPLEPLEELRDLVEKYKGEADNVHALERLMLHHRALSPRDFSKFCQEVLKTIAIYEEVYQRATGLTLDGRYQMDTCPTRQDQLVARSVERYKADFMDLKKLVEN